MELKTYGSKLIDFLSLNNTVIVDGKKSYNIFVQTMTKVGLSTKLLDKVAIEKNYRILVEYDNSKGFTIWNWTGDLETAVLRATEWYYESPLTVDDIKLE